MKYRKINAYTWVLKKEGDEENIPKPEVHLDEPEFTPREKYVSQTTEYKKFCKEVFSERKFICVKEFNKLIVKKFNNNATYYRKRMITLGFITEKNRIIKKEKI